MHVRTRVAKLEKHLAHWMPRPEICPECGMKDGDTVSGPLGGVYIIEDGGGNEGIDWVWCTDCHRSFAARLETREDDSVIAHDAVPADMPLPSGGKVR